MEIFKSIKASPSSDAELVAEYRQGHRQEVLANLYLRYYELVYGVCVKYLADQEAARDAVMDIYQELLDKLKNHQVENFKSWLYVVTKNHCLLQLRKNKRLTLSQFDPEVMQFEDFSHLDNVLDKEQQLRTLEECLQKLQDEQRQTVKLFYLENKCYNEISTATGFDWNKVRSLVQNGRRNLKICMEKNG